MIAPARSNESRVALSLLETRVDIAVSGSGAADLTMLISAAWNRCLADPASSAEAQVVHAFLDSDATAVSRAQKSGMVAASDERQLMHWLTSKLTVMAITARLGELWMLHASAVAHPETGSTVVLVAPSGGGKTTAAVTLGSQFAYVSDETVAISPDGTIVPYPKPLSVIMAGGGPKWQRSPTDLGLRQTRVAPRLGAIVLLERRDSCHVPAVEAVRAVEALPALAEQTSALQRYDRPLHMVAHHLDRIGGLKRIAYREAEELIPVVGELIGGER